jgi:hypothetical protein
MIAFVWVLTEQTDERQRPEIVGTFDSEEAMLLHAALRLREDTCLEHIANGEECAVTRLAFYKLRLRGMGQ